MALLNIRTLTKQFFVNRVIEETDIDSEPVTDIFGSTVVSEYVDGLKTILSFDRLSITKINFGTVEFVEPNGRVFMEVPNLDLSVSSLFNGASAVPDYYDQFDGIKFVHTDFDETLDGDNLFRDNFGYGVVVGLVGGLLDVTTASSALAAESLFDKRVVVDFMGGDDTLRFDLGRDEIAVRGGSDLNPRITVNGETIVTRGLEELRLNDGSYIFDESGDYADYTYAIFTAALARTPREEGFRFWNGVMNKGGLDGETRLETELNLAQYFVDAPEFERRFDTGTDEGFIDALYENVLGRAAKQAGFEFWLNAFQNGVGRDEMLRYFAISDENMRNIADDIDTGYWVV